ncbi:MAG: hypothetical protein AAF620_12150 [Bacteroidota bacterium]
MKRQTKITSIWAFISLSLLIHFVLEIGEGFYYSELPKEPYGESVPTENHIIYLIAMILPLAMAFVTLFISSKPFKIFSLVYASLLTLINAAHAIEGLVYAISNVSQVVLLLMVVIFNISLLLQLNHWRKEE